MLNSNGTFVISYGNQPQTTPSTWSVDGNAGAPAGTYVSPFTVQNVPYWTNSQYYIFGKYEGSNSSLKGTNQLTDGYIVGNPNDSNTVPDFMQLNDDGTISIYQGNNGIKTNPNENALYTRGTSVPVTAITLNTITYDTADTVYQAENKVAGVSADYTNNTGDDQNYTYSLSLTYTNTVTFTWNVSATLSATISSSTKVTVPGIGDETNTISLTGSATISKGQSTTETTTITETDGGTVTVPGQSEYSVTLTGDEQVADVPYTWTGIAYYKNGYSAPITGSGVAVSDDTGVFNVTVNCVYTPGGCPVGSPAPVPEPSTLVTVPMAFAAMLLLAAVRRRRSAGRGSIAGAFAI